MYGNLIKEMALRKVKRKDMRLAISPTMQEHTLRDKINGKYDFKITEATIIRDKFFPDLTLDYLFKKD